MYTPARCVKFQVVLSCIVFQFEQKPYDKQAKLDDGLDESPTVMVVDKKQNKRQK